MWPWWRRWIAREVARVRRNGTASVRWSLRITIAATAAYVVGTLVFPHTQPLLAPLTAMLVIQVTPRSLLASGLDRIIAVVAGVGLATAFAAVVPLTWWSLGLLIFVAITIGQYLRLRSNLVEVAISAMLVLGVGTLGAEAAAWQRIIVTVVGGAVGIVVTLVFPPKVSTGTTGRAIDGIADALGQLLVRAADELDEIADDEPARLGGATREWLDDARRINHDIPAVGAALLHLEDSRRLNVRAAASPHVEPGLRQGIEAIEHSTVAVRGMMRTVADVADGDWLVEPAAAGVLHELASTFRAMAGGVDAFGELVRNEADVAVTLTGEDVHRLRSALGAMHAARARHEEAMATDLSPDALSLHADARANLSRLMRELDLDERVRRQLHLLPPRRRPARRPPPPPPDLGPDAETQVLPPVRDLPPRPPRHPRPPRP